MRSEFLYLHHIRERCGRIRDCVQAGRGILRVIEDFLGEHGQAR